MSAASTPGYLGVLTQTVGQKGLSLAGFRLLRMKPCCAAPLTVSEGCKGTEGPALAFLLYEPERTEFYSPVG